MFEITINKIKYTDGSANRFFESNFVDLICKCVGIFYI